MKAIIHIYLKDGVLDPGGQTIARSLRSMGFDSVKQARQSKMIELDLSETDKTSALSQVEQMCNKLLANTVIEDYQIEIIEGN